jgi:hypothetical protein
MLLLFHNVFVFPSVSSVSLAQRAREKAVVSRRDAEGAEKRKNRIFDLDTGYWDQDSSS